MLSKKIKKILIGDYGEITSAECFDYTLTVPSDKTIKVFEDGKIIEKWEDKDAKKKYTWTKHQGLIATILGQLENIEKENDKVFVEIVKRLELLEVRVKNIEYNKSIENGLK